MILTVDEYKALGFLNGDDSALLERCLLRAEEIVKSLVCGGGEGFPAAATAMKKAVAFQAEYYIINGFEEQEQAVSVKIGDFSYTDAMKSGVSRMAVAILKKAGLMYGGCEVRE